MAAWQQGLQLSPPAGLAPLASGVSSLATAANATLDVTGTALDAAKFFLTGTVSPQAAAAAALVGQAEGLVGDLFGAGFYQVVVHPWTPGVGRGQGPWRHLAFPACVRAMAESFDDAGDLKRPQFSGLAPVEMVALVAGAASPALFKTTLDALNALLDAKELRLAVRRIEQAFRLEAERYTLPRGPRPPDWQSVTVRQAWPALVPLETAARAQLAMLKAYAAGNRKAVDTAVALITAKQQQLTALQGRLDAAMALFGRSLPGAGIHALHVKGAGGNALLKSALLGATGAPGPELSFCAGMCWVGAEGSLDALAQILGL